MRIKNVPVFLGNCRLPDAGWPLATCRLLLAACSLSLLPPSRPCRLGLVFRATPCNRGPSRLRCPKARNPLEAPPSRKTSNPRPRSSARSSTSAASTSIWTPLDLATGKEKWKFKMGAIKAPVSVSDGAVYVGDDGSALTASMPSRERYAGQFPTSGAIAGGAELLGRQGYLRLRRFDPLLPGEARLQTLVEARRLTAR